MTPFGLAMLVAGGVVVFAGLLLCYTVLTFRDHVLYPTAIGALGVTLIVAGIGTATTVPVVPGGETVTLSFVATAGIGYCFAGWRITAGILETDELVQIHPTGVESTEGFATDQ